MVGRHEVDADQEREGQHHAPHSCSVGFVSVIPEAARTDAFERGAAHSVGNP
jgi:hypothetical protein